MNSSLVGLLPLLTMLAGGAQERPFSVESAYHEDATIRFMPSQQQDWASMAPDELRAIPIPTQDSATVARLGPLMDMFGGVEMSTAVATPAGLASRYSYFAGAEGVSRLEMDSTKVVTRLDLNRQGTSVQSRQSWGEVYGSAAGVAAAGGGFVLLSERPLSFQPGLADFTADDLLLGSSTVQQTSDGYWGRGTAFWEIAAQYRFSVDSLDDEWLFVQWQPDREMIEAGCQYRYELFHLLGDGSAPRVAWTSYGCDV